MQISVKDILKGLAENTRSPLLISHLHKQMNSKNHLMIVMESFSLPLRNSRAIKTLQVQVYLRNAPGEDIQIDMTDDEVKTIIRTKIRITTLLLKFYESVLISLVSHNQTSNALETLVEFW